MKIITKTLLLTALLSLVVFSLNAQNRVISGTITDAETGEALIGASVLTPEGSGTVSDFDGNYSVRISEGSSLQFSYTGYATQIITPDESNLLNVQLSAGTVLDEVVVIGYGTVKREDATGSIQSLSTEDFNQGAINSPQELLAGKVAGVQITTNSGAPGEGSTIRIRGGSSLSASNDPLVVIDGVPVDNGEIEGARNVLNFINPNDIETFTVLKDASATAIYGSRASNGVILITTKKGALGKAVRVNYAGQVSFSSRIEDIEVLEADEFRALINKQFDQDHPAPGLLGSENTDWQDEIYDQSFGQDHNLSISGGIGEVLPYRASFGYTSRDGILKTDNFQRTTGALNLSPKFLDNTLQFNLNVKGMLTNNQFANRDAIGTALTMDPTQPVLDSESPYGGYFTWTDPTTGFPNRLAINNPLALLEMKNDQSQVQRLIVNGSVDYRMPFLPELRANLNLGYDNTQSEGTVSVPANAPFAFNSQTGGGTDNTYDQNKKNSLLEFYLNYAKDLGKNRLDVMAGYSWQRFFFQDSFRDSDLAGTPSQTVEGEDSGELFLVSLFGRVNFSIQDRVFLTGTLRRDGSSRFSPENRWGLFPAAAVAVKLIDDETKPLSNLKFRLGYGVTGQQEIGSYYQFQARYLSSFGNAQYQFGDDFQGTLRPEGYDRNIKWEETTTYNVGLDYSLFGERIYGTLEYYIRQTKDLLNFIRIPAGTNLTNFLDTNVGNLENRGVEFSLNTVPVQKKDLIWELGVNVTRNRNEITKLTATDDPTYQGVATGDIAGGVGNTIQIHSVGFPARSFFVFEQVYDETGTPIEGLYVDRNGDGVVDSEDQYRPENPAPDWYAGINTSVTFKELTLSASGRANMGNAVYNNIWANNAVLNNLYHPTNYLSNVHAQVEAIDFQNPQYLSDHFIQDASFFRLDFITLSYDLSKQWEKGNVRVSATLQNPLLITNYQGVDPEIETGIDNNIYPRSRTFVIGVNAGF